jgi:phosphoribosyl 1,2-cyclic phosphodiesterase
LALRAVVQCCVSFFVQALASGSSGNATLVRHAEAGDETLLLIDAGLSVAGMEAALKHVGAPADRLSGIILTHEHVDHARAAYTLARKFGAPLIGNSKTLSAVMSGRSEVAHIVVEAGGELRLSSLSVRTFSVPHDAVDPVGVNIEAGRYKVTHITDAGCITPTIRREARGAHLLILEANHDVHRLKAGPYPDILKRRILSDRGHLSNEAAASFLVEHLFENGPCCMWLAHLSKTNNLPKLALNYARATLKLQARCPFVLDVAQRDRPSARWTPGGSALQLNLFQ